MPADYAYGRSRLLPALALLTLSLCAGACAGTQLQRIAPRLSNMVIARHYLGEPAASERQPDGTVLHEWLLDRRVRHAGGMETRTIYVGHDRDGYRVYRDVEVYVRPWEERQYCRARALADSGGRVLHVEWEGPSCDELPRVPLPEQ